MTEDALSRARRDGYINLAFINNAPYSYIDPATGLLTGSGIAVAEPALEAMGIAEYQPILVDFPAIIPGLIAKRWDMSAFTFFITPERCSQVAFTDPVAKYTEGALVKEGNPLNIRSYADLAERPDIKVGAGQANAEAEWAKQVGITNLQLFPDEAAAVSALKAGRIDAFLNATLSLQQDLETYGATGIELADPFTGPIIDGQEVIGYAGWALRHEDVALRDAFNEQLARMLEDGSLLTLVEPYGFGADTLPTGGPTAKELCPDAPWIGG